MEVLHKCCCGLDVHQAVIVACLIVAKAGKKTEKVIRKFRTVPAELQELVEWVQQAGCTLVAMESTGVYWLPIYERLEGKIELLVANAQHMKNLPGRKTDIGDCEWIAELARHGLLRPSFIPAKEFRELRDVTRYRSKLTQTRVTHHNRLLKQLEQAGVKLSTFVTDVMGVSGRRMIQALLAGDSTATEMADLAKGALRHKIDDLELALDVELSPNQKFLIGRQYEEVTHLERAVEVVDVQIAELSAPYAEEIERLRTIPGISTVAAPAIIGEVGTDLSRFRDQSRFSSWIGVAPGNNESAGKRKDGRTRTGNVALKTLLVECAWAAVRTKGFLHDKYYQLRARRGAQRAIMAIAHKLAIAIFHVLRKKEVYRALDPSILDRASKSKARNLVRRLEHLGYQVTPPRREPVAAPMAAEPPKTKKKPAVRRYVLKSNKTP